MREYQTGGNIHSSPALSSDGATVFVGSSDNSVYAFDTRASYSNKWVFDTSGEVRSSPALSSDDKTVFVGTTDNKLYAVNTADGTKKWEFEADAPVAVSSSPALSSDDKIVYVGCDKPDSNLYAIYTTYEPGRTDVCGNLAQNAGDKKWEFMTGMVYEPDGSLFSGSVGGSVRTSPVVSSDDNTVFVTSRNGTAGSDLAAVNTADGKKKWIISTGSIPRGSSPVLSSDDKTVYTGFAVAQPWYLPGGTLHGLYAVNTADGTKKWVFDASGPLASSPILSPDGTTIFVASDDADVWQSYDEGFVLYAINTVDGTKKWEFRKGKEVLSTSLALSPDYNTIFYKGRNGRLYANNVADGSEKWDSQDLSANSLDLKTGGAGGGPVVFKYLPTPLISPVVFVGGDDKLYAIDASNGNLMREYLTGSYVRSSPAVSSDGATVFVGSHDKKLYAFDTRMSNCKKWEFLTGGTVESSPALSSDGATVFVGSNDFNLYAVNTADGTKKWEFFAGDGVISSPALSSDDKIVFVGSNDYMLYAVNTVDGTKKWEFPTGGGVRSSPALSSDGATVFVGSRDKKLYAIDASNGNLMREFPTGDLVLSSPALSSDGATVFVGSHDDKLYAVNTADGTKKWEFVTGLDVWSSPALSSDGAIVFVGSYDNKLYAIYTTHEDGRTVKDPDNTIRDASSAGSMKWEFLTGGFVHSSPALSSDGATVFVGSYDKKLYAIYTTHEDGRTVKDPDNTIRDASSAGSMKWEFLTGDIVLSSPALFEYSNPIVALDIDS
jgi:outer membrane protein assembly factor BamB